ncbi:Zinc transporter ZIP14 isoform 2 [Schistosoma japonicum]|uniref:Zinc transporter ZIP14 isoform 2 n=2 Tax=Schistosoma japonicum TaxID=6182 RepID=A0A4Z2DIM9_SCHJA|nr:Zinc transporter ZIP14 [Schistosoma japonicum]TNN16329.1 Zinc transporter ZIP14 isoform 2 [Schistosoma japonicum]
MKSITNKRLKNLFATLLIIFLWSTIRCQGVTDNQSSNNQLVDNHSKVNQSPPTLIHSLTYGILCVTISNACAFAGIIFILFEKYSFFQTLISFMVATAVGSLLSTAVIVLTPQALAITHPTNDGDSHSSHPYVSQSICVCAGVIFFYILEFCLRHVSQSIQKNKSVGDNHHGLHTDQLNHHHHYHNHHRSQLPDHQQGRNSIVIAVEPLVDDDKDGPVVEFTPNHFNHLKSINKLQQGDNTSLQSESPPNEDSMNHLPSYEELSTEVKKSTADNKGIKTKTTTLSSHTLVKDKNWKQKLRDLEPVAWMIVIGDGAHNFMDGLSIGVGFTQSISLGISLTLAIICEELPHELGDIAVLLRSGLTVPMAMLLNFISACTAYIGFFIGITVGELSDVAPYVFAVTGGFFMYIALADMLPEMRAMEDAKKLENGNCWVMFFTNLAGLLFGFGCIVTITLTSQYITI